MIGALLTSSCYYDPIEKQTFYDRVEELVNNIRTLENHIKQPFELIIADNSPPDNIPTEKIIQFRPKNTLFIRETENPGKSIGEATLIRDGVHLSQARGHKWLLKLSGRYFLTGDWSLDETLKFLEEKQKPFYLNLNGKSMKHLTWATKHPYYKENLDNDKILISASTQAFIVNPEYLVKSGIFQKEFLYREYEWVNFEQLFWHAVKDLNILHWPDLPIDGFEANKFTGVSIKGRHKLVHNPVFETAADYKSIPQIDITPLVDSPV